MPKSPLTPFHQSNRSIQEVTPCPAYIASAIVTARFKTYDFVQYVPKSMQNCKFYIGKLNLHLITFDPSVWSCSMHPPMWPQDLGRNVHGGFWKYWFSIYCVPLSTLAQSAKICWSRLPQYFLLKRWPNGEVNEIRTRYERDPTIPKIQNAQRYFARRATRLENSTRQLAAYFRMYMP